MRVSREEATRNRTKVIDAAGRLLCERGFDGVGVDAIMSAAGLTHGGFYGQFASKEALAAEALDQSLRATLESQAGFETLADYVEGYLTAGRRDDLASCGMAAMGLDAARRPGLRAAIEDNVRGQIALLEGVLGEDGDRAKALLVLSAMVGAMVIARGVETPELRDEILDSVRRRLTAPREPSAGASG